MKVLNLIKEFEMQRMKELETIKEYSNKLLGIVNKIKLMGKEFQDSKLVEKILVTVLDRIDKVKHYIRIKTHNTIAVTS